MVVNGHITGKGTDTNAYDLIKNSGIWNLESLLLLFGTRAGFYDRYDRVILDWYLYSVQGSDAAKFL